jgi:hypothetical protein
MTKVATEPVETPADDALQPVPTDISNELVERWPSVLRAADTSVHELDGGPAARLHVPPQLEQLVLGCLIVR